MSEKLPDMSNNWYIVLPDKRKGSENTPLPNGWQDNDL
ncbi:hypothetical protein SAMN05216369_0225 [Marinobacter antarcticus]|uniref:Uncharacterized protein n=1 Tax=Marinobacter antarcticus TaxID=564117 RepID=A0A1M6PD59_9GAMM|nr:hypothetical protein SAMN05216369_0225 [Marinobacter antarcticus]